MKRITVRRNALAGSIALWMALICQTPVSRAAEAQSLSLFEQMTAQCVAVITNTASTDLALREAISHLGPISEPPSFWHDIITNSFYGILHRKRCAMALFRRHGSRNVHIADLAGVLDAKAWIYSEDIRQIGAITGSIPVEVHIDETIFLIQILDRIEFENATKRSKEFGVYVRVLGKVQLEEFSSVLRTGRPSVGDGNIIIRQFGYADDYDEWFRGNPLQKKR
jgi:hypothetical protein